MDKKITNIIEEIVENMIKIDTMIINKKIRVEINLIYRINSMVAIINNINLHINKVIITITTNILLNNILKNNNIITTNIITTIITNKIKDSIMIYNSALKHNPIQNSYYNSQAKIQIQMKEHLNKN